MGDQVERPEIGGQSIDEIFAELRRAEEKHPGWPHDTFIGLAIIGEELGEANQAAIEMLYRGAPWANVRKEVVQVAVTALRFLIHAEDTADQHALADRLLGQMLNTNRPDEAKKESPK